MKPLHDENGAEGRGESDENGEEGERRAEPRSREQRYTEVADRATALFTGSFANEMILSGVAGWMKEL